MTQLILYTDGGCRGNPGLGGWGYLLIHPKSGKCKSAYQRAIQTTNNQMEMQAAIQALKLIKPGMSVEVRTDSKYLINMCVTWRHNWKKNNWRRSKGPVSNLVLVKQLDNLCETLDITWTWVKAHSGESGNEFVDHLANLAMDSHSNKVFSETHKECPVRF